MSTIENQETESWSLKFIFATFVPIILMMVLAASSYTVLRNMKDIIISKHCGLEVVALLKSTVVLMVVALFTYFNDMLTVFFAKKDKSFFAVIVTIICFTTFYFVMSFLLPKAELLQNKMLNEQLIAFFGFERPDYSVFPYIIQVILDNLYTIFSGIGRFTCNAIGTIFGTWIATSFYCFTEVYGMMMISIVVWGTANQIIPQRFRVYYPVIGACANFLTMFALEGNKKLSALPIDQFNIEAANISFYRGFLISLIILCLYVYIAKFNNINVKAKKEKSASFVASCVEISKESYPRNIAIMVGAYNFLIVTIELVYKAYVEQYFDYSNVSATVSQVNVLFATIIVLLEFVPILFFFVFKKRQTLLSTMLFPALFISSVLATMKTILLADYYLNLDLQNSFLATIYLGIINSARQLPSMYLYATGFISLLAVIYTVRNRNAKEDDSMWLIKAFLAAFAMGFTGVLYFMIYIWSDAVIFESFALISGLTIPGFIVMVGAMQNVASKAFKYVYFDYTKEAAFSIAPQEIKVRFKAIIDVALNRFSKSIPSYILLLFGVICPPFTNFFRKVLNQKPIPQHKIIDKNMELSEQKAIKAYNNKIDLDVKAPYLLIIFIIVVCAWIYAVIAIYPQYQEYAHPDKKTKIKKIRSQDILKLIALTTIALVPIYTLLRIALKDIIAGKQKSQDINRIDQAQDNPKNAEKA